MSDAPAANATLTLSCVLFGATEEDEFTVRMDGTPLPISQRNPDWKDPQVFSPAPQPASGGKGQCKVNPKQRLLRLDCPIPRGAWRCRWNRIEIRLAPRAG